MFVFTNLSSYTLVNSEKLNHLHVGYYKASHIFSTRMTYDIYTSKSSKINKYSSCYIDFTNNKKKLIIEVDDNYVFKFKIIKAKYNNKPIRRLFMYLYIYYGKNCLIKHYMYGNVYKVFSSIIEYNHEKFKCEVVYRNDRLLLIRIKRMLTYNCILTQDFESKCRTIGVYFDFYHNIEKIKYINLYRNINMTFERYVPFPILFFNKIE